jgi:hypothetical protein
LILSRCENKVFSCGRGIVQWECICDCNLEKIIKITTDEVRNGKTNCGCIKKKRNGRRPNHGMSNTRLFNIWGGMQQRCYNINHEAFAYYGGRGILICEEWLGKAGFQKFYNWAMNNGYNEKLTLDRINTDESYIPENCRWATRKEQQNNRRNNIIIEYNGITKTMQEWCDEYKIPHSLAQSRYKNNLPFNEIFSASKSKKAEKQSGIKGIIWNKKQKRWIVKGIKSGKKDCYLSEFEHLRDAILFKENYDKELNT